MKNLSKLGLAAVLAGALFANLAMAEDKTGIYVGVNGGYNFFDIDGSNETEKSFNLGLNVGYDFDFARAYVGYDYLFGDKNKAWNYEWNAHALSVGAD